MEDSTRRPITDAGAVDARGFLPTEAGWVAIENAGGPEYQASEVRILHPVHPGKILAIGLNYRTHAEESGVKIPEVPVVFAIWPSALIGPRREIVIPSEETQPDFEGEVAIVIGRPTYRADREEARASGRRHLGLQRRLGPARPARDAAAAVHARQELRHVLADGSVHRVGRRVDLEDIDVRTTVSGELMQDANTCDLIFSFVDLIEYISAGRHARARRRDRDRHARRRRRLAHAAALPRDGDTVEIYVEGVGTLTNPVRDDRKAQPELVEYGRGRPTPARRPPRRR